jgi:hypothetical protein
VSSGHDSTLVLVECMVITWLTDMVSDHTRPRALRLPACHLQAGCNSYPVTHRDINSAEQKLYASHRKAKVML